MSESSKGYHEPVELLPEEVRERHRAMVSVIEELEAVDWYDQRAAACSDEELRDVLIHNRDEEMEHAAMALEWLRRRSPEFAEALKTYLFTEAPIVEIEEEAEGGDGKEEGSGGGSSLGIGDLKRR